MPIKPVNEVQFLKWVADNAEEMTMALDSPLNVRAMQTGIAIFRKALEMSGRLQKDPDLNKFTDLVASGILIGWERLNNQRESEVSLIITPPGIEDH